MSRFLATLEAAAAEEACAWIVRRDDPAVSAAPPCPEDLADAAQARASDGGAGRLWRRRLVRTLAARWLGAHPADLVFQRDGGGRAQLVAPVAAYVSAASRGDWSVVAVGRRPLGVDLELAGAELARFARGRGVGPAHALRRFTAAEAFAKACGCPLDAALAAAAGLSAQSTRLEPAGLPAVDLEFQPFAGGLACLALR